MWIALVVFSQHEITAIRPLPEGASALTFCGDLGELREDESIAVVLLPSQPDDDLNQIWAALRGQSPSGTNCGRCGAPADSSGACAAWGEDDDALFARAQRVVRRALLRCGAALVRAGRLLRPAQVFDLPLSVVLGEGGPLAARDAHADAAQARKELQAAQAPMPQAQAPRELPVSDDEWRSRRDARLDREWHERHGIGLGLSKGYRGD